MTEWALRCREQTIAAYMREHIAITNVIMFAFQFTVREPCSLYGDFTIFHNSLFFFL